LFILLGEVGLMPQNKKQSLIFTFMMAFGMVLGMALYNALLRLGMDGQWVRTALYSARKEYLFAVPIAFFLGGPLAMQLTLRYWPEKWRAENFGLGMSVFTPFIMVPIMTVLITVGFHGNYNPQAVLYGLGRNYLFAWPLQILLIGPIVRKSFGQMMLMSKPAVKCAITNENRR
jgi:hypothetical protein